ncbi:MAG: hypothetical protein ABIL09_26060, partial [Gemmatimonadota bacterium]
MATAGALALGLALLALAKPAAAQDRLASWTLSGLPEPDEQFYPRFEMSYVSPALHKWYQPRNLAESYLRPFYVADRLTAGEVLVRDVSQGLEGDEWYDRFGRRLGRGWLLYSWEQQQAQRNGSVIRTGDQFGRLFQNLVVATDGDGRGTYRLMVGGPITGYFTPL